jgi:hypothetical protein
VSNRQKAGPFVLLFALAAAAWALPHQLSYQGKLTDTLGNPVNGMKSMAFRLYRGSLLYWTESQNVLVDRGLFSVVLGAVTPIESVPAAGVCSLEMVVEGQAMARKLPLVSAPYAYDASGLQGRPVAATVPSTNQVLTWTGGAWEPATPATGSGCWTEASDHVFPSSPNGGNDGIRAYRSGHATYNLYGQTNASGQYGVYGYTGNADPSYAVAGQNQAFGTLGVLGYGHQDLTSTPKIYPSGARGSGGTLYDGVYGITGTMDAFGVWGHNTHTTGTGVVGSGNNQSPSYLAAGSGGYFSGYQYGVAGRAYDLTLGDQAAGGYFQADGTTTNRAWVACWSAAGNGYRIIGNGTCATGFDTRDGERVMTSVEMPEARERSCPGGAGPAVS